jgi:two-component system chemotaxis response regulator CheY
MKILIIDDSTVMRRIHHNILKENNFKDEELLEAEDGVQALKYSELDTIDLFLVDWNMPKLDGVEFVKKIRSMEK